MTRHFIGLTSAIESIASQCTIAWEHLHFAWTLLIIPDANLRISNARRARERVCNCGYVNYTFAFPFHFNKLINSYFLPLVHSSQRAGCQLAFQLIDATMLVNRSREMCTNEAAMVYLRFGFSSLLFLVRCTQFILLEIQFFFFFIGMNLNKQTDTRTHSKLSEHWNAAAISFRLQRFHSIHRSTHTDTPRLLVHSVFIFGSMLWARRAYWLLF